MEAHYVNVTFISRKQCVYAVRPARVIIKQSLYNITSAVCFPVPIKITQTSDSFTKLISLVMEYLILYCFSTVTHMM